MKKLTLGLIIAVCAGIVTPASAQTSTTTATTSPAVSAYLAQLQILRELQMGMSGSDVLTLQAYLATHPDIYPEALVTGFYGPLTSKAVAKLQMKLGLPAVGRVGPMTLKALNHHISSQAVSFEHRNGSTTACAKIPPGHFIAPGQLKKMGALPIVIPPCQILPPGIAHKLGMIATSTATTTATTTSHSQGAPVISLISATSTTPTTATIKWTTDVPTKGKIWYGTSTPVTSTTSSSHTDSSKKNKTSHSLKVSNLMASTTYYYVISASNKAGVTATTSQQSFMTVSQ